MFSSLLVCDLHGRVRRGEDEEEETDDLVNQVLDEIGIGAAAEVRLLLLNTKSAEYHLSLVLGSKWQCENTLSLLP